MAPDALLISFVVAADPPLCGKVLLRVEMVASGKNTEKNSMRWAEATNKTCIKFVFVIGLRLSKSKPSQVYMTVHFVTSNLRKYMYLAATLQYTVTASLLNTHHPANEQ